MGAGPSCPGRPGPGRTTAVRFERWARHEGVGAVATAGCGAFEFCVCHAVDLSVCAHIQGCWDRMKLRDVHTVVRAAAKRDPLPGPASVGGMCYVVLDPLESSHA